MDKVWLRTISQMTRERYMKRFKKYGESNVKSLGWGTEQQQSIRFFQILKNVELNEKSIIDIGCGFGDFRAFLIHHGIKTSHYIGLDMCQEFLNVARYRYPSDIFRCMDLNQDENIKLKADVGVMLGLLNYKFESDSQNLDYSFRLISKAFQLVNETLVLDFISSHSDDSYPIEPNIYYHNPSDILDRLFSISKKVRLMHDYPSIPQREFMVVIEK